jgi:N-methylhydantoinase A/oxoprolinase/acetone carboxylase beta subunit
MRIGIDIGGTHTDSVLIDGTRLIAAAKAPPTMKIYWNRSIRCSIQSCRPGRGKGRDSQPEHYPEHQRHRHRENRCCRRTGCGGTGIAPETYRIGDHFHVIPGSLDHLGTETAPLDEAALQDAIDSCLAQGVQCFAVAAKFSPRNPVSENRMREQLGERADVISSGHLVSGQLNFGRRIHTAYYNSAVWKTFRSFSSALTASLRGFALQSAEVNILKADGGTMPLARALETPVQSIFSGPAASVMGILATTQTGSDLIMLDIGGTTTDIALFASGQPLLEREGIAINNHPTLVRAIQVESIGIGGDSLISIGQTGVRTGPHRLGPCLANGGPAATLMDACNVLICHSWVMSAVPTTVSKPWP